MTDSLAATYEKNHGEPKTAGQLATENDQAVQIAKVQEADPISADAYHIARCARDDAREASGRIVKHLWIIFMLLPIVLMIIYAVMK